MALRRPVQPRWGEGSAALGVGTPRFANPVFGPAVMGLPSCESRNLRPKSLQVHPSVAVEPRLSFAALRVCVVVVV